MHRRAQQGVLLVEVLVAILIFALGVLGLVALQANAVQQSSQSRYRSDAALLANDLISQMWVTDRTFNTLNTRFSSAGAGGADYNTWKARVNSLLPVPTASPPVVAVQQMAPLNAIVSGAAASAVGLTPSTQVTITIFWKAPAEKAAAPAHSLVLINEIK